VQSNYEFYCKHILYTLGSFYLHTKADNTLQLTSMHDAPTFNAIYSTVMVANLFISTDIFKFLFATLLKYIPFHY